MKRLLLQDLREWYKKKRRKPLIIWGARQVGKTYLVRKLFLEQDFNDFVFIDLKKDDAAAEFFSTTSDPSKYLSFIELRYQKRIANDLPLVFDEVQQCPSVITSLKYFKDEYPGLPVIATGSMVRIAINRMKEQSDFLYPVGAINSLNLFPLTFEEYLLNTNGILLQKIKEAYDAKTPLESYEHELAMDSLYTFLSLGGMPEVVDNYIETGSFIEPMEVLSEIYDNYIADMSIYNVSDETILKTRNVYRSIYSQLNKENRNFKITSVEKGKSNRDYFNAYQWLEMARVVYRSRKKTGRVTLPLTGEDEGLFRLYLSDVGIFTHQSGINRSDFMAKDKRNDLSGIFYENYVADEFRAKGIPLYYWMGKSGNEFEFIVEYKGRVSPVDVKKGKGRLSSLRSFREYNPRSTAIKISANNFGYNKDDDILTVPLYAVFALANELGKSTDK